MKTNKRKSTLLYPELSYLIQGCVFEVRNQYGPGQKEVIYHRLLEEKLALRGIAVEREKKVYVYSNDSGKVVGLYQPDMVIEEKIVVEIKSSRITIKEDEKQLYYYLRNSKFELGYLINFFSPELFLKRIVYSNYRKPFLKIRVD